MKNAIEKAIEGGYYNGKLRKGAIGWCYLNEEINSKSGIRYETVVTTPYMLLDPLFWQCLGKAMGWGKTEIMMDDYTDHKFMGGTLGYSYQEGGGMGFESDEWRYNWHRFIDDIAEGGDVDKFFKNLLK